MGFKITQHPFRQGGGDLSCYPQLLMYVSMRRIGGISFGRLRPSVHIWRGGVAMAFKATSPAWGARAIDLSTVTRLFAFRLSGKVVSPGLQKKPTSDNVEDIVQVRATRRSPEQGQGLFDGQQTWAILMPQRAARTRRMMQNEAPLYVCN